MATVTKLKPAALPKPPVKLSPEARKLWDDTLSEYEPWNAADLKRLARACEALNRLRDAQRRIAKDGAVIPDGRGSKKAHPAVNIEKEAHRQLFEALKSLHLGEDEPAKPGHPPGTHNTQRW